MAHVLTPIPDIRDKVLGSLNPWRPLYTFAGYRVFLALVFAAIAFSEAAVEIFSRQPLFHAKLFYHLSYAYLIANILLLGITLLQWPSFNKLVFMLIGIDILFITLLMHAAGGVVSGLGTLLVVNISAATLLRHPTSILFFAALATISVLFEHGYQTIVFRQDTAFANAGGLGATYFATALLGLLVSRRLTLSESMAESQRAEALHLAKLNDHIVQYMNAGVLVVNPQNRITTANQAALDLLNRDDLDGRSLNEVSQSLTEQLAHWRMSANFHSEVIRNFLTGKDIRPHFSSYGEENPLVLIILEDVSSIAHQAQQLKLASLGRLTASIAHEIRNPLGAISHASQLLGESDTMVKADKHLVSIIDRHCQRMNGIIENVMQLSQKAKRMSEHVELNQLLVSCIRDYQNSHMELDNRIDFKPLKEQRWIEIDSNQVSQVIHNIIDNGLRYSEANTGARTLAVSCYVDEDNLANVDFIDQGEGLPPDMADKIFEPFFTTHSAGTGLGLYISKELCEANQALLAYKPVPRGGTCFTITFTTSIQPQKPINDE
ncbi:MAG: hypothetical protein CMF25_00400 [Kangiellaceae bacterium]|nr:hypothetical protein [Kangiellaceae bacterium]